MSPSLNPEPHSGVVGFWTGVAPERAARTSLERLTRERNSRVVLRAMVMARLRPKSRSVLYYRLKLGDGLLLRLNTGNSPIGHNYRKGNVQSTLMRECNSA